MSSWEQGTIRAGVRSRDLYARRPERRRQDRLMFRTSMRIVRWNPLRAGGFTQHITDEGNVALEGRPHSRPVLDGVAYLARCIGSYAGLHMWTS
jgi:hypothetical protein